MISQQLPGPPIDEARTIWVVVGSAGEYSDRNEWCAAAFLTEQEAIDWAVAATELARALLAVACDDYSIDVGDQIRSTFDPAWCGYTDGEFRYKPCAVRLSPPKPEPAR